MKNVHTAGLVLWRGGILLAIGYPVYFTVRLVLRVADPQVELGLALCLTGVALVLASLIGERIRDARTEGSLEE